jgi:hypothetical protein
MLPGGRFVLISRKDYLERITDRTREQMKKQYEEAVAKGDLTVFFRDESERILRSYVFPLERGVSHWGQKENGQNNTT